MIRVALDGKFDAGCSILQDRYDRSCGSEIHDVQRRLVLSPFTFYTDIPNNTLTTLTVSSFQFQRELQGPIRSRAFS